MLDGCHHAGRRLQSLIPPLLPDLGHRQQYPLDAGPPVAIVARNIRAAKVRPAIGCKKRGERPPALTGNCRDRGLVTRVHVGPLVAIHLHRNKVLVDELCYFRVFVGFAVHHVAPVAPHRANVQQDGFVFGLGTGKRRLAPWMPVDRLMPG